MGVDPHVGHMAQLQSGQRGMTRRLPVTKWVQFSDAELRLLWDELRIDDGIAYSISEDDVVAYGLAQEILAEARERELELPDADCTL